MKEVLNYIKTGDMKWIKASERLPEGENRKVIRRDPQYGNQVKEVWSHTLRPFQYWLDESAEAASGVELKKSREEVFNNHITSEGVITCEQILAAMEEYAGQFIQPSTEVVNSDIYTFKIFGDDLIRLLSTTLRPPTAPESERAIFELTLRRNIDEIVNGIIHPTVAATKILAAYDIACQPPLQQ